MSVTILDDALLREAGLVLQGVLPANMIALPELLSRYRQLLVFAHGGRRFWQEGSQHFDGDQPLDDFSKQLVEAFMARIGETDFQWVYPEDDCEIDLIELGRQLGWHHDSPMGVGIHNEYGTWFAYRAVVATNTNFNHEVSESDSKSPCVDCSASPCISACPAGAVSSEQAFDLRACASERLRQGSACANTCLARLSCPAGAEHRYHSDQLQYHYGRSLIALRYYSTH